MTRRDKLFGQGRAVPLDREAKAKLMHRARALVRTRKITGKTYVVFETLLYGFHNAVSGHCFPSYETLAKSAGCARSTIALAVQLLEASGLLTWHNRISRIRTQGLIRVVRTSNAYQFPSLAQESSKSETRTGTSVKILSFSGASPLEIALQRLGGLVRGHILTT